MDTPNVDDHRPPLPMRDSDWRAADDLELMPWDREDIFPLKPSTGDYGYLSGKRLVPCGRDDLSIKCSKHTINKRINLVWIPEFPRLLPAHEVPFLFCAVKQRTHAALRDSASVGLLNLVGFGFMAIMQTLSGQGSGEFLIVMALIGGVLNGAMAVQGLWNLARLGPDSFARERRLLRYQIWLATCTSLYSLWVGGPIVCAGILQILAGLEPSIRAAGLVKQAVWAGEIWRMATCCLLHVNLLHFLLNIGVLISLSQAIQSLTHRAYVPIVFCLSGLVGSAFSLALTPEGTSVGASGGIVGFIGFLTALGWRRMRQLPPGFVKIMLLNIGLIACIGFAGRHIIDNGAHLGGLIGGLICGLILIPQGDRLPLNPGRGVRALGWGGVAGILLTTAWVAVKLLAKGTT